MQTQKSHRRPWNTIPPQNVEIPKRWLSRLYKSTDMLPFLASLDETQAIIPVDEQGRLDLDSAREEFGWKHLDEIYRKHRGQGRNTPRTLAEQIDFHGKLSAQPQRRISDQRMVLYPKSGDIMRAARTNPGIEFVNDSLYWHKADSVEEAGYLTILLNAPCLQRAFFRVERKRSRFSFAPVAQGAHPTI